ncbi:MAG: DUF2207 domain-containing protein [Candidatus Pacebacteria bacterium]|nr:DUF2207 domain-containing protein [Candidatus Paceibacterota bacterium]
MNSFVNKRFKNFKLLFLTMAVFIFCFNIQTSFAGVYHYKDFEVDIKINEDSTFDVTEKQTYYLNGSFGFFNRDISLYKIDAITDIEVFDGDNNRILKNELEIKSVIGKKHIQWNFPRRFFLKEEKSWTVKYKVHGGINFLKDYDEIYWNAIPPNRTVSVENVKVIVNLPNDEKFRSDLIKLYSEQVLPKSYYFKYDNKQAVFEGKDLRSNTNFTIAVGFPKGIVSQIAYGKDFLMIYYGYILSVIIFLSCLITGSVYWYKTERSREGKRAIIPQYEPPQNLRPAMAEIIVKEKLTNKGLAATIIDLAVRGYVRIEEDPKKGFSKAFHYLMKVIVVGLLLIGIMIPIQVLFRDASSPWHLKVIFLLIFIVFLVKLKREKQSGCVDYRVIKIEHIDHYENDSGLEDYEKKYLNALFGCKNYFSTKEIKKDPNQSRSLFKKIKEVKDKIYEETELDTGAFEIGLTMEKNKKIIWAILIFATFFSFQIFFASIGINQFFISALIIIVSVIGLYAFIKYEARLSDSGIKLKEDWLGFKMYLKTAERYRMQDLKPEFFEKYLPYAMIFGVEKKWAKTFESMHVSSPSWYVGSATAGSSLGSASSFSPTSFSNSFSSSFASAFSSSGASGASGGGGGAGGGGGGGGGGAG